MLTALLPYFYNITNAQNQTKSTTSPSTPSTSKTILPKPQTTKSAVNNSNVKGWVDEK